ncbi:MAG: hypothetical protein LW601_02205 [Cryomorphaceae bacterium]|jgi:hypothetical protein|nr:hypothetical protein [Cryomorphaceae bacterium]
MQEQRYRLRFGDRIVGYLRRIEGTDFYSPDGFWWTGKPFDYAHVDEAVGLRDKFRVHLYEWDIVRFKPIPDGAEELGVFLWNKGQKRWILRSIESEVDYHLELGGHPLIQSSDVQLHSHVFLNPELQRVWGLEE